MNPLHKLCIRADASTAIGTGHIMRMIALAETWKGAGGKVIFLSAEITPALEERIVREGLAIVRIDAVPGSKEDLEATCSIIGDLREDRSLPIVLDGYQFDGDFQRKLMKTGCRLLLMDDYGHAESYHADWVLNQNISAGQELYHNRSSETKLLLGTQYVLLRQEFLKYSGWKREIPETAKNVLVTLGGSDPGNVTQKVIEALAGIDLKVKVVVGGSNPHLASLRKAVAGLGEGASQIELVLNPTDIPALMAWADLAVAAGGSTAWELCFMGVPSIYLILAENQREISLSLERMEMGVSLDTCGKKRMHILPIKIREMKDDQKMRETLSVNACQIVDGAGASRVCKQLSNT